MVFSERIIRVRSGIDRSSFAAKIGVSERTVERWERNESLPKANELIKIHELFGYDIHWLLTGEKHKEGGRSCPVEPEERRSGQISDFIQVPKAEAHLSAGGGSFVLSEQLSESYSFRRDWVSKVATSMNNILLMSIDGDSMCPTLQEGDMVMVDTGRIRPSSGKIYAFTPGDNLIQVKRLESRGNVIRVISDNRDVYDAYNLPYDQIRVIGEIIWFARELVKY